MANSLAYQAEKQLKDLGDKVPAGERSTVEGLVSDLRQAINQENYDRMKSLSNDLQQALMQVGSAVYGQAGGTTGDGGAPRGSGTDDVIDADFVDSK
nr:Hsp70 family protein [Chroococcidiopsis sp. CCMEE 29]